MDYFFCNLPNTDTLLFKSLGSVNQPIRMISEGSCDTEDWSNYPENVQELITF